MAGSWPECVRPILRQVVEIRLRTYPRATREDREDLVQDALLKLIQVPMPVDPIPYAAKATHHVVTDYLRKTRRRWEVETSDVSLISEPTTDPWPEIEAAWAAADLAEPGKTIVLLGLLGFEDSDVGTLLHMTPVGVRQARSRARRRMRETG
ncbi:MAG: sigma-70 family RNA polymerase sigma factor [Fimbriimonadaceae bacterium]|nr:sigma-70 family RNA polymerase sigma factor [Fimbriimonadaceae bacterium]